MNTCSICCKSIKPSDHSLKCDCCLHYVHRNCTNMNQDEYTNRQSSTSCWSCIACNELNFPFNHILDDNTFISALPANDLDFTNLNLLSSLVFVPFEFNDEPMYMPGNESDPDINFFNQLSYNCNVNSNYYLEDNFNQSISDMNIVKQDYFSFFHMNIRSLRANMNKMLAYIDSLDNKFDVLGLSET